MVPVQRQTFCTEVGSLTPAVTSNVLMPVPRTNRVEHAEPGNPAIALQELVDELYRATRLAAISPAIVVNEPPANSQLFVIARPSCVANVSIGPLKEGPASQLVPFQIA